MALADAIISVNSQPTLIVKKKNISGFSLYIVHVITSFNCTHRHQPSCTYTQLVQTICRHYTSVNNNKKMGCAITLHRKSIKQVTIRRRLKVKRLCLFVWGIFPIFKCSVYGYLKYLSLKFFVLERTSV